MSSDSSISITQSRHWADRLGTWTSALCLVHCLLTPALLSFSAVFAYSLPADESVHRSLAVLVALFGTIALVAGFRRHRRRAILFFMLGGLGCIAGTAWLGDKLPSHAWGGSDHHDRKRAYDQRAQAEPHLLQILRVHVSL